MCLGERVSALTQAPEGHWVLTTDKGEHLTRTVVICAGVGAFAPNKLAAPGVNELEGVGVHYFVKEKAAFKDKNLLIVGGETPLLTGRLNLQGVARRSHLCIEGTSFALMRAQSRNFVTLQHTS